MTQKVRIQIELSTRCVLRHEALLLLEAVAQLGSIRQAAFRLRHSYRHAWTLLDALNKAFDEPVARAEMGGVGGGGVELTPLGNELLKAVGSIRRQVDTLVEAELASIATKASAEAGGRRPRSGRRALRRRSTETLANQS